MPLLNEKPMENNKRYSLTYQFKQFDWDKEIFFDDPYKSQLYFPFPKAHKLALELHKAINGMITDGREHYRWEDHLYFNHNLVNMIAATMVFLNKHMPGNMTLAHVISVLCFRDTDLICNMLESDYETEIVARQYNETKKYQLDAHYISIKSFFETVLGKMHHKEFFFLCIKGYYNPDISISDLNQVYDEVMDWTEKLYKEYCPKNQNKFNEAI